MLTIASHPRARGNIDVAPLENHQPMPRIQCKNCGKLIEVRPDDAGAVFVCAACGTRNEAPLIGQDGQAWAAMRQAVEKDAKRWKNGTKAEDLELEALVGAASAADIVVATAAGGPPTAVPPARPGTHPT